jgi:cytochrome c-type biogenesis protein CcmE
MTDTQGRAVRSKPRVRARYVVAALVCVGVVVWMLTVLQKNALYLRPVSDAVERRADLGDRNFRMGGTVVPGSIERSDGGAVFEATEGGVTAQVDYRGGPPDLFKDCAPVVVRGHWVGEVFRAEQLMIKHGSEYDASKRTITGCEDFE